MNNNNMSINSYFLRSNTLITLFYRNYLLNVSLKDSFGLKQGRMFSSRLVFDIYLVARYLHSSFCKLTINHTLACIVTDLHTKTTGSNELEFICRSDVAEFNKCAK